MMKANMGKPSAAFLITLTLIFHPSLLMLATSTRQLHRKLPFKILMSKARDFWDITLLNWCHQLYRKEAEDGKPEEGEKESQEDHRESGLDSSSSLVGHPGLASQIRLSCRKSKNL
ncbi:hypothetical protein AMECASPLE_031665 [Ameca splendens]|uniref:Uncharacterized protein n=1 Tax=Ameca splendens TaxID=208324 RepID=A0ABV0YHH0_9TELE